MSEAFHFSPRPNRAHEIRWQHWGPDAFARAQAEDKPILLSLSAVWCHWCHVMDETTYSAPSVITAINERFVPIRVDNDRRPDINARYNMGGWPTTALLMPGGQAITGATYVPPEQMETLLERVSTFYRRHKDEILERVAEEEARVPARPPTGIALSEEMVQRVVAAIGDLYDPEFGGFGSAPKFPMTDALELLLERWLRSREAHLGEMLGKTLRAMANGGMYDHVEGGWFRYSTDRQWRVPHFEKMAEDHAGLLRVYARFARVTRDAGLRERIVGAVRWLTSTLYDPESGLFGGSQDADEAYYEQSLPQRRAMAAPYVDRTCYANWTAALAGALFDVAALLEDDELQARAARTLDALWERMHDGTRGLLNHVLESGKTPEVWGLLTDQAAMLRALLDGHAATGATRMLARAERLADETTALLGARDGGFFDRVCEGDALGALATTDRPLAENASVAASLLRLSALADRPDLRSAAERALLPLAGGFVELGAFAAPFALAVARAITPSEVVTIVAQEHGAGLPELLRAAGALRGCDPLVDVRRLESGGDGARLARSGYAADAQGRSIAYVCVGSACAAPTLTGTELEAAYRSLRTA